MLVPAAALVTMPELLIVATEPVTLLHVPPVDVSPSVVVDPPAQRENVPVIGAGPLTVILFVTEHLAELVYVMVAVPKPTPVTLTGEPVVLLGEAIVGSLVLQVPPVVVSVYEVVAP